MSKSSSALARRSQQNEGKAFVAAASAAVRRAARQVAAENKRLGLPLIAEMPKRWTAGNSKRR